MWNKISSCARLRQYFHVTCKLPSDCMKYSGKKSIAYYVLMGGLTMITLPFHYILVGEPSFSGSVLLVRYRGGLLGMPLWTIIPTLIFLTAFLFQFVRALRLELDYAKFLSSVILGVIAIGF